MKICVVEEPEAVMELLNSHHFKQISAAEANLSRFYIKNFYPHFTKLLGKKFAKLFELEYNDSCDPTFKSLQHGSKPSLRSNSSYALINTSANNDPILIELENDFIRRAIKGLLGTNSFELVNSNSLSELEHGLFSFLMLKFLKTFNRQAVSNGSSYHLIETGSNAQSNPIKNTDNTWSVINFELHLISTKYLFRIMIPATHISPSLHPISSHNIKNSSISLIPTDLAIELARTTISKDEIETLQLGDLLIFDEASIQLSPSFLAKAQCIIPSTKSIGFSAIIKTQEQDFFSLTFESSFELIHTSNQDIAMEQNSTSEIINTIPCTISIEVARLSMPLAELNTIAPGYVLELSKKPQDPVNIVANGAVIGKGELVDVEGVLGVRVLALGHSRE